MPQAPQPILSKDPSVRLQILEVVAKLNKPQAIEKLIPFLLDEDDSIRGTAERTLAELDPAWEKTDSARKQVPLLEAASHHDNYWIGLAAVEALKRIKGEDAPPAPAAAEKAERTTVTDHYYHQRRAAARILASALKDPDPDLRLAAAEGLGKMGEVGFNDALAAVLHDSDEWVRFYAASSLRAARWQGSDDKQKAACAVALGAWEEAILCGEAAVEPLLAALQSADAKIRERAALALGRLGSNRAELPLGERLEDRNPAVRRAAATALSQIGPRQLSMEQRNLLVQLLHS